MMQFAFKHMERSEAVENAAKEAFDGVLSKFRFHPTSFNVTFSVNNKFQSIHISAHFNDGFQVELEQGEEDIYKSIELITEKLERQLIKHKEKLSEHR